MSFVMLGDEVYPLKTCLMKTFARKICHVKNVFSFTGCRKQGDALSVRLVS